MQSNISTLSTVEAAADIISENALWFVAVAIRVCLTTALSILAFITNICNVIVFSRMDINKSVKDSFIILSIVDCLSGFLGIMAGVCNALRYLGPARIKGSMYPIYFLFVTAGTLTIMLNMMTTTVIAVTRCCCVVLPFRFKEMATVYRQRISILLATFGLLCTTVYSLTGTEIRIEENPTTNMSQLVILFHPEYIKRSQYSDIYRGIMFYLTFFTVIICLFALIIAIKRSLNARIALRASNNRPKRDTREDSNGGGSSRSSRSCTTGVREAQVIKVVILVSIVFAICNTPLMVASILRQTEPGLNNVGVYKNSFDLMLIIIETFSVINASFNILIYLKFNTAYYTTFKNVFVKSVN
ncbi:chemosensory receptor c [Plakobranchus ocellatus]|uniref:Chemosensory receptor c n=1 Tax=Plakobranchus ocellatus TaxID=259542 RepID=A0AAV4ALY3_9GAST|nr:chemosensory receptor c [Plakobranchus ocellatus]